MSSRRCAHPFFARYLTLLGPAMARQGAEAHRRRLLATAAGEVLEIGAGDGATFALYPPAVTRVLAVEPEPYLRARATERASAAAVPVDVVDGVAERLPAADGSVDVVVASLVLCSVSEQAPVLAEVLRVLRPGGRFFFYEHVADERPGRRKVQRVLDATLWPRLLGGCHTGRDTVAAVAAAGFVLDEVDRFDFPDPRSPAAAHVLGRATRPAA